MNIGFIQDALFSAIAAIGFASISNPPRAIYGSCALTAAIGHSCRYLLMSDAWCGMHIIPASTIAAFLIGTLAVLLAPRIKCPAEACFSPALLPMIPGVYAYRTVKALLLCLFQHEEVAFNHYLYLLMSNGLTCMFIILGMVVGATIPMFLFKKISFQATR
ncbi:MAG: threonine/serine exporter family protein [Bacteroidaceae bacterium]|nr:threonine/serine exporter family protein [Bacteroidaceae bacterium]